MSEASEKEFVKDGYINLPASLGEASPLQNSSDYIRNGISRNYELLTILYRENWIAKRIIDMPCEDMTREWYTLSTELRQDLIDKIKKVEAKHNVKGELTNALRWARLYGGSLALIVIKGQEDMLDEPLDYDMIMPGSFKGLLVLDMVTGITPSIELEEDMDDPDFGLPKYYDVVIDAYQGEMIRLHHSRVLRFVGRDLPPQEEIREDYWGASELEHIYEELQKRNATSANIAQLVFQANTRVLKMADYGEVIGMGTNKQKQEVLNAIEAQNRLLTSFGVQIMGTEDNMESHPYSFSGISEVYESFMMDMAGAANIPATKLFGRSPQGMNATGESDMNNYYESIAQMQERQLKPALERLLPVICMSIFGAIPNDMEIVFEPIATTTPEQRANIGSQFTGTVIDAFSAGLIGRKTALMELKEQGKELGVWTKISDETIEEADDEVDNGEMGEGEMPPDGGEMMGGMPGMESPQAELEEPEEPQAEVEEQPQQPQVPVEKAMPTNQPQVEKPKGNSSEGGKIIPLKKKEQDKEPVNFKKPGQRKVGSVSKFVGDFVRKVFKGKETEDAEEWRTTEEGNHFKLETTTGEVKSGLGGKMNGRILGSKGGSVLSGGGVSAGSSGGTESKQESEYHNKIAKLKEKSKNWSPNHKAYVLFQRGIMSEEDALKAAEDGTIDKHLDEYFDILDAVGDPTPTKPLRGEVSLYQEVEKEGKHGGSYEQAREDYIKDWTGCTEEEAKEYKKQFDTWFSGRWYSADTDKLDSYIDRDGAYDGEIFRGMSFDEEGYKQFMEGMKPGAKFGMRGYNSSWATNKEMALAFSRGGERSVVVNCVSNKTSAPVSHLSSKGEEEVIAHSKTQWVVLGVKEGTSRTEIVVMEASDRMSDSEKAKRRKSEKGGVIHDSVPDNEMMERMNEQDKYFHVVGNVLSEKKTTDGGPGSGNFHDTHHGIPGQQGGSAPSGAGGSGGNHATKDEIRNAAKSIVAGGYKSGIDKKGMDRHRNKANAEKAAKEEYEKAKKKYDRDIAEGRTPKREPRLFVKSYFDGVNADFMMRKCLELMADDEFDNTVCKWYNKSGGENKCQITFKTPIGYTTVHGSDKMAQTNTVTITYSSDKKKGFHCFPDEKRV